MIMTWELRFMEWANGWGRSPVLDQVLPWLTHLGSVVAAALFILVISVWTRRKEVFYRLALISGFGLAIVHGLKFVVHRQRPPVYLWPTPSLSGGPGEILDHSFPSAHTFCAVMIATLLASWFPRYRLLFFVMAGFVGWTRIYLGLHYPTDVVAGALLGYGLTKILLHWIDVGVKRNPDVIL